MRFVLFVGTPLTLTQLIVNSNKLSMEFCSIYFHLNAKKLKIKEAKKKDVCIIHTVASILDKPLVVSC